MSELNAKLTAWSPRMLSVLRIVTGLLFLEHGTIKLFGFPPDGQPGVQHPMSFIWIAGLIEAVTGVLATVGLFTRAAAFIASGEMAVGYWMSHAPKSLYPAVNMGDAAILFCFVFLYLVFSGPGPWSLDAAMRRRAATAA